MQIIIWLERPAIVSVYDCLHHGRLQMETLLLRGCEALDDNLIPNLVTCISLDVGCTSVTDKGLLVLATVCLRPPSMLLLRPRADAKSVDCLRMS